MAVREAGGLAARVRFPAARQKAVPAPLGRGEARPRPWAAIPGSPTNIYDLKT